MSNSLFVSFIILTFNSEKYIENCIDSVLNQDYENFEILVIDAGSTDRTRIITESFCKLEKKLKLFIYPGSTIGFARQKGTEHSLGEYCAFIDSDCVLPSESWLAKMMEGFNDPIIVGTWTLGTYHKQDPSIMRYSIISNPLRKHPPDLVGLENFVPVGTGHTIIQKNEILAAGGFQDLLAAEDIDLVYRLVVKGFFFKFIPNVEVYHYHVTSFSQFLKKTKRNLKGGLKSSVWQEQFLEKKKIKGDVLKFVWDGTFFGPFLYGLLKAIYEKEYAWLWHPYVMFFKTLVSFHVLMSEKISRR
jgi:glycosyltransferase involved in cell wall biosynthesis